MFDGLKLLQACPGGFIYQALLDWLLNLLFFLSFFSIFKLKSESIVDAAKS
jgi:hypothetical protein